MMMEVIRIDGGIVTCQLEDGHIIDIDQRWFKEGLSVGDELEFSSVRANR